jgi:acetyl-CoA C-acetyltransferase
MSGDPARIPVVVGVGQLNDRPKAAGEGLSSVDLMAAAARIADRDIGSGLLARCDWLAIVPQISFRDLNPANLLPGMLGISPKLLHQAPQASGDTPILYLSNAANAIASGQASVCLVAGGEALRTAAQRTAAAGTRDGLFRAHRTASDLRRRYGLLNPTEIYPLYENATRAAWGQSLVEGQAESALIWSAMSKVAATSEGAWIKSPKTPQEILEPSYDNRPIAFPYRKFMVANSSVNQGAAFILCSLAIAREAGVPENRLVYVGAGAAAHEPEDPLVRASWAASASMRVSLERAISLNGLLARDLDHVEFYSCFPCVPKMARRIVEWPLDHAVTVHGGLTFGGGPVGNYMSHAVVAMVQVLRRAGRHGLLFANGGYCTHNHSIVLSRTLPREDLLPHRYDFQAEVDHGCGTLQLIGDEFEGRVIVETYTVVYDRAGAPTYGIVIAKTPNGSRVVAKVDSRNARAIDFLTSGNVEPVGSAGITNKFGDILYWLPAPER